MRRFFLFLRGRPLAATALGVLIVLYLMMLFAECIAPFAPTTSFPDKTYHPPNLRFQKGAQAQECRITNTINWKYARIRGAYTPVRLFAEGEPYKLWNIIPMKRHLFGTNGYPLFLMGADHLGRDIFSRIVYGSRISLTIGFIATGISLLLAVVLGGPAGYFGGAVDWTIMRSAEFFMLIPGLYLILFLRSLLSANMDSGQAYMMITIILALVGWPGSARTIRGLVHSIKREDFILNAQLEMIPAGVIIPFHIIPQIASLLIVSVALSIPGFIMTETTLSYLGLGIVDPAVSWGSLIRREISSLNNLRSFPWLLTPVYFLLAVTLAFNFLGDALRDFYDPYHAVFSTGMRGNLKTLLQKIFQLDKNKKDSADESDSGSLPEISAAATAVKEIVEENEDSKTALIKVRDLRIDFLVLRGRERVPVQAVRGVSFDLARGEILGIVGESGSGKSVSTQAIPRLLPANARVSGSIRYDGQELLSLQQAAMREYRGRKIGMIFQEPGRSFDPLQNIESVFLETFRNSIPDITREDSRDRAIALLEEVAFITKTSENKNPADRSDRHRSSDRLGNFPHQFSGGQLQRIGIALALAQNCEVLIADEPTTALDVTIQRQIVDLLCRLRETRGISIIFISHDLDLVAEISDRILVMYGGLLMESGEAASLVQVPRHPYTRALLAASPKFGSHYSRERLVSIQGKVSDGAHPEPGCPFAPRCLSMREECNRAIPPLRRSANGQESRCLFEE